MKYTDDKDEPHQMMGSPLRIREFPSLIELANLAFRFLPQNPTERQFMDAPDKAMKFIESSKNALLRAADHSREYWHQQDKMNEEDALIEGTYPFDMHEEVGWEDAAQRLFPALSPVQADKALEAFFPKRFSERKGETMTGCWLNNCVNVLRAAERERQKTIETEKRRKEQVRIEKVKQNLKRGTATPAQIQAKAQAEAERQGRVEKRLEKTKPKRAKASPPKKKGLL